MTMNRVLLGLIVASAFLLIFYANSDLFTRRRWSLLFGHADDDDGSAGVDDEQSLSAAASAAVRATGDDYDDTSFVVGEPRALHHHAAARRQHQHQRTAPPPARALTYADIQAVRYAPATSASTHGNATATEHNIFVIYTKETAALRSKFELFCRSLLKYASVRPHLHIITDAASQAGAEDVVRREVLAASHRPATSASATSRRSKAAGHPLNAAAAVVVAGLQYSLYNVTEAAQRVADITRTMMPHSSVAGSQYDDALFYVSFGLHRVAAPGMRRAILIDCDVVFRSDVARLFEEFNRFGPDNLFGLAPELTPVYYHILHKYRARNPSTGFGKPYYPAAVAASADRQPPAAAAQRSSVRHGYPGLNSGVVMLQLERMRRSKLFAELMRPEHVERLYAKYAFRGHLGDQDYYTLLGWDEPGLFYRLDCVWNRQLCTWWKEHGYSEIFDTFFRCEGKIRIYHGNCNTRVPEL